MTMQELWRAILLSNEKCIYRPIKAARVLFSFLPSFSARDQIFISIEKQVQDIPANCFGNK